MTLFLFYEMIYIGDNMKTVKAIVDGKELDVVVELDELDKDDTALIDQTSEDALEHTMEIDINDQE